MFAWVVLSLCTIVARGEETGEGSGDAEILCRVKVDTVDATLLTLDCDQELSTIITAEADACGCSGGDDRGDWIIKATSSTNMSISWQYSGRSLRQRYNARTSPLFDLVRVVTKHFFSFFASSSFFPSFLSAQ